MIPFPEPYNDKIILLIRAIFNGTPIANDILTDSQSVFRLCVQPQYFDQLKLIHKAFPVDSSHIRLHPNSSYAKLVVEMLYHIGIAKVKKEEA